MSINKSTFCAVELTLLLRAIDRDIQNARYEEIESEEYVHINFNNGSILRVCVTADSLVALTRDVLRRL